MTIEYVGGGGGGRTVLTGTSKYFYSNHSCSLDSEG